MELDGIIIFTALQIFLSIKVLTGIKYCSFYAVYFENNSNLYFLFFVALQFNPVTKKLSVLSMMLSNARCALLSTQKCSF